MKTLEELRINLSELIPPDKLEEHMQYAIEMREGKVVYL